MTKPTDPSPVIPDYQNCPHISDTTYQRLMPMIRACRLGNGKYLTAQQLHSLAEEARYLVDPPAWWEYLHKDLRKTLVKSFKQMKRDEARKAKQLRKAA